MPLGMRLEYLATQIILVGSRHPRLRRRVSPLLHYTISDIALDDRIEVDRDRVVWFWYLDFFGLHFE
jgi:hypothetical protein